AHGEIAPKPQYAIFADTGWEMERVYRHLEWLEQEAARFDIPIIRVSAGNIRDDLYKAVNEGTRFPSMPFFLQGGGIHHPGNEGKAWRQCTQEYKIKPIQREVRRLLAESGAEKAI